MNCNEIGAMLDAVDPRARKPAELRAISDHFAACRACREAWAAYEAFAAAVVPDMPRDLPPRVAAALEAMGPERAPRARKRGPFLAAGLFAVGAAVAGAIVWRSAEPVPDVLPPAEQPVRSAPAGPSPVFERDTQAGDDPGAGEVRQAGATPQADAALDPNSIVVLPVPDAALDPNGIVVLPVPDAAADPRLAARLQEYYEEFLVQLSAVDGLNVVSHERVQPFIGSLLPEEEIAQQLGAGTIVVLGIYAEDPVGLTVVAIDGATGASRGNSFSMLREPVSRAETRSGVQHTVAFIERLMARTTVDLPARIADARAVVLNAALSDGERVAALRRLPLRSPGAYDDAIVAAAVEIATTSGSASRRAYVWQVMHGVGHRYLVEPLLQSLAYDAADHVRRAAATTLGDFRGEPRVRAALAQAEARDTSDAVREAARLALLSAEERNDLALSTLLDETLPDNERLYALMISEGRSIRGAPLTAEAAQAVFEIATSSKDAETRSSAWMTLYRSRIAEPTFAGALLDDVANHPSATVRWAAARALEPYRDDPEVHAALEQAQSDPSAEVRRGARLALGQTGR